MIKSVWSMTGLVYKPFVTSSSLKIDEEHTSVELNLKVDTEYSEIGQFFEIFMDRLLLCHKAAKFLNLDFNFIINGQKLM